MFVRTLQKCCRVCVKSSKSSAILEDPTQVWQQFWGVQAAENMMLLSFFGGCCRLKMSYLVFRCGLVMFLLYSSNLLLRSTELEIHSYMSATKEDQEIDTIVTSNGRTIRINEAGLHLYPVSGNDTAEGLPYAPVDWPNAGDKWGWRAGKRVSQSGYFRDRYLYVPKRLGGRKDGKRNGFRSILLVEQYLRSEFPSKDINEFFASFSWKIPSKQSPNSEDMEEVNLGTKMEPEASDSHLGAVTCRAGNKICTSLIAGDPFPETMFCDICCTEPGFCRDCCCILCCKTVSSAYNGYSYIRCEAKVVDGYICGHISHVDCALRAYMAGTVGGSIGLDAEYFCRYCDSRMDLVSHALKLLNICASIASRADIEKILNVGICILRGSQKKNAKQLLHRIESTMAKLMNGACIEDVFKNEDSVDSTGLEQIYTKDICCN